MPLMEGPALFAVSQVSPNTEGLIGLSHDGMERKALSENYPFSYRWLQSTVVKLKRLLVCINRDLLPGV